MAIEQLSPARSWVQAFRLRTLPLAVSSIIVGSALGYFYGAFHPWVMVAALLTAVLLQILSNLANDLGDHQHGTDNDQRIGPDRAVQSGAISPTAMKRAMVLCGVLAFCSGLWLILTAFGHTLTTVLFLLIGLAAIGAAVKYTYGRNPYGYAGYGDIAVFVFFGLVGVIGTAYSHTLSFHPMELLPATTFGLLSAAVLNVNNMRDIKNDARMGKRTLVVRIGLEQAKVYQLVICGVAFTSLTVFSLVEDVMPWWAMVLALLISAAAAILAKLHRSRSSRMDPYLKRLALLTFITAITFSASLWLS
ncbi:MAG: 1,4-dihydroxy-2-naphthoate octaprenyltransferase [Flavobacteriales bacterium]